MTMRALASVAALAALLFAAPASAACGGRDLVAGFRTGHPDFAAALDREAAAMPYGHGRLFRVSRAGVAPSWLFGTMHADEPEIVALSPAVAAALAGARTVALELERPPGRNDPTMGLTAEEVERYLLARTGESVKDLVSAAESDALTAAAAGYGIPAGLVQALRPTMLAVLLSLPACATANLAGDAKVLDERLGDAARAAGKRVVGLETAAEQLAAVTDFPASVQREVLVSTVRLLAEVENMYATVRTLYLRGEIGLMLAWSRAERPIPDIDARSPGALYAVVIDARNARLAERARPLLEAGGAFVAIGAAHLPGEAGMLRILERDGWIVTPIE